MSEHLIQYDSAKKAIAEAKAALDNVTDFGGAKAAEAGAETLEALARAFAKQANDPELIELAIDLRMRAQIKAGEFLLQIALRSGGYASYIWTPESLSQVREMKANGASLRAIASALKVSNTVVRKLFVGGDFDHLRVGRDRSHAPTLNELGINHHQSLKWQRLARLSEEDREVAIQAAKDKAVGRVVKSTMKTINPVPRPKRHDPIGEDKRKAIGREYLDEGKTWNQLRADHGVSSTVIRSSVAREEGRREAEAEATIDPSTLSKTAQQKLEAAISQEKSRLRAEFDDVVKAEIKKRIDEMVLPAMAERQKQYERVVKSRKRIMAREEYRLILSCLHPDQSASPERIRQAFETFKKYQLLLCAEMEIPAEFSPGIPRTYDEMMKRANRA